MKLALLICLIAVALPARATAPKAIRLTGGPKSEDALRRFVERDPCLKARFKNAAQREELFLSENRDPDLRDAVSGVKGADLIEQLPGMKAPAAPVCRALADCAVPELALDVPDAERLPESVRRMVRPWMLLQQARGALVELVASESGDSVLTVKLKGLNTPPLTLNMAPRLLGGFKVWFDQPFVLASLYGRERDSALER